MDDHWCLAATATQQQHHKGVRRPSPAKGLELGSTEPEKDGCQDGNGCG